MPAKQSRIPYDPRFTVDQLAEAVKHRKSLPAAPKPAKTASGRPARRPAPATPAAAVVRKAVTREQAAAKRAAAKKTTKTAPKQTRKATVAKTPAKKAAAARSAPRATRPASPRPAAPTASAKSPARKAGSAKAVVTARSSRARANAKWVRKHPVLATVVVLVVVGRLSARAARAIHHQVVRRVRAAQARRTSRIATAAKNRNVGAHAGCSACGGTGTVAVHASDGSFAGSRSCPRPRRAPVGAAA
ncbi:hypothetical protein [Embleya hyalina]|uniref:Uncharacterized protein n=1 Tax=Embleya hyalina TaxID=516124 RepID=A0A401Z3Z2_9ACTN|nr:hypothetical protein [Embleya hyalina]GCE01556.1 hypothetical protein EHYA_09322 [Embleya hyalina]